MIRKFNSNKSPTRCNNFPVYYPDVYLQLNMFRAFSRPSSGTQWLQWQPLVLLSYRGHSRAVVRGRAGRPAGRPDHEHSRAIATAVIELLMMGGRTPETCWAVNKHQNNKLENFCIWLVIYLNCTMMTDLQTLKIRKFYFSLMRHVFRLLRSHHQTTTEHSHSTKTVHSLYLDYFLLGPDDGCVAAERCRLKQTYNFMVIYT
jgi:hypothetical protein